MSEKTDKLTEKLEIISRNLDAEMVVYSGEIDLQGVENIIECTKGPERDNILLLLCTPGGDPHCAFKIARRLQEKYKKFYLYVYGYCKSAGTLIAIGSDEIIMSDYAEFGPLDVQLQDKDEIWKYSSGLNIDESLRTLKGETVRFFKSTMIELITEMGISTKTAAEISTHLAIGFINPIVSQIDPVRVGEIQRAVKIALAYGERLIKQRGNISNVNQLVNLITGYPDHGFTIDYEEAKNIFKNVRKCNTDENEIGEILKGILKIPQREGMKGMKIYPLKKEEINDGKSNQPTDARGIGEAKKRAGATDKAATGEVLSIEPKRGSS